MNNYLYHINPHAQELPLYLCTVGVNLPQYTILRPGGIEHYQLLLGRSGTGRTLGQERTIQHGDVYYLPPHETHAYEPQGDWVCDWLTFGGTTADALLPQTPGIWRPADFAWYTAQLEKMAQNDRMLDYQANSVLLYELVLRFRSETQRGKGVNADRGRARLQPVLTYMQQHFAEPITVPELAAQIHVTDAQFCRIFRSVFHTRPMLYLNFLRVSAAKQLMRAEPELPVGTVAIRCGFGNSSYFGRVFLRSEGVSASVWRTQHGIPDSRD